jgi:hypothetical protein
MQAVPPHQVGQLIIVGIGLAEKNPCHRPKRADERRPRLPNFPIALDTALFLGLFRVGACMCTCPVVIRQSVTATVLMA